MFCLLLSGPFPLYLNCEKFGRKQFVKSIYLSLESIFRWKTFFLIDFPFIFRSYLLHETTNWTGSEVHYSQLSLKFSSLVSHNCLANFSLQSRGRRIKALLLWESTVSALHLWLILAAGVESDNRFQSVTILENHFKTRHSKLRTSLDHLSLIMHVISWLEEPCLITKLLQSRADVHNNWQVIKWRP